MDHNNTSGTNGSMEFRANDRRLGIRFPLAMELNYRIRSRAADWVAGRTINISSSGALIRADSAPVSGSKVDMAVIWPRMLDGRIPLRLVVQGRVVRAGNGEVAITFQRFEFRTARAPGRAAPGAERV